MRSLRWTYVVAAVAAFCLGPSAGKRQYGYYGSGPGMPNVGMGMGMPAYPSAAGVPAYAVAPTAPAIGAAASPAPPSVPTRGAGAIPAAAAAAVVALGLGLGCGGDPAWRAWGDYLYLRPRNDGVEYAVPLDPTNTVQVGHTAVMNPQFSSGFRVGIDRAVDDCSEIAVSYTYYRDENNDGTAPTTPFSLELDRSSSRTSSPVRELAPAPTRSPSSSTSTSTIGTTCGAAIARASTTSSACVTPNGAGIRRHLFGPVLGAANAATNVNIRRRGLAAWRGRRAGLPRRLLQHRQGSTRTSSAASSAATTPT